MRRAVCRRLRNTNSHPENGSAASTSRHARASPLGQLTPAAEAYEVWNMGIGLLMVVRRNDAEAIERALTKAGHPAFRVGEAVAGAREVVLT